jgi:nascent polypeptide-associated complex subunit alpha
VHALSLNTHSQVKIEDITGQEEADRSDDEPPGLEDATPSGQGATAQDKANKQSRTEKKSRKAIQKLGMKPVSGIIRVTVKKAKSVCYPLERFSLNCPPHYALTFLHPLASTPHS